MRTSMLERFCTALYLANPTVFSPSKVLFLLLFFYCLSISHFSFLISHLSFIIYHLFICLFSYLYIKYRTLDMRSPTTTPTTTRSTSYSIHQTLSVSLRADGPNIIHYQARYTQREERRGEGRAGGERREEELTCIF